MITATKIPLPLKTAQRLVTLPEGVSAAQLSEIRLRAGRPAVAVTTAGKQLICSEPLSRVDIEECFLELCRHSVHSFSREISEGWITLSGGHRAGFCGTAVLQDGRLSTLRDISSINLRLARELHGCGEALYHAAFSGGLRSALIAGKPLSGKTTILRDLSRLIGAVHRVALIDSRNELAACLDGVPQLDVGLHTDVLSGYPRAEGMEIALRTLSPEVIICDELGSDLAAVRKCLHCGVKVIATLHCGSLDELSRRPDGGALLSEFGFAAVLCGRGQLAELKEVRQ